MALLTAILTHLDAPLVERQLAHLRSLAPGSRFVVCHGGRSEQFTPLSPRDDAIFVDDPSLRGPHFDKSLNHTLEVLFDAYVRDDESIEFVYVIEYDHLILRADFESRLEDLARATGAGLLAKWAGVRNDTNWSHYLKARGDARLDDFISRISVRDDPSVRLGCLGTGLLIRRDALGAFRAMREPPAAYVEMFVPTTIHHLGFEVVDVDAVSDLYLGIRWLPEYTLDEALERRHAGAVFVHPFKDLATLPAPAGLSR